MPVPDTGCLWHSLKLWLNYYSHPYRVVCMVSCEFTSTEVIRLTGDLLKCIFVKEIALILLSISPNWVRKWPSWQYASTDSVQVNSVRANARPLPEPIMIAANWRLHASPSLNELMYHFMCSGLCSRIIFLTQKSLSTIFEVIGQRHWSFARGIHHRPMDSFHDMRVTWKKFPRDDVIKTLPWNVMTL